MRSKSFAVRSRPHRASRSSLDPYPSPASLPGEANERFASVVGAAHSDAEIVPDTFDERDVPPKKRHCLGASETTRGGGGGSNLEACIVCDISDEGVSRCSGTGCILSFHGECLNPELSSSEDLEKTYCPYCWFKVLVTKHESVREKNVEAENEETKSKDRSVDRTDVVRDQELRGEKEQLQVEKDSDRSREEEVPLTEEIDHQHQEDTEKFQDTEEYKDDEETRNEGGNGDVSGKEQDQIQRNEIPRRRRRQLILSDSEISSDESANEGNGEDVTSASATMNNQQRKHSSTTKVVKQTTVRETTYFSREQRKRLFWTPEEEEMLKVGVEKFSAEAKKNMPWRKILEMGEEVFHETRTPADLKDKWRNMARKRGKETN